MSEKGSSQGYFFSIKRERLIKLNTSIMILKLEQEKQNLKHLIVKKKQKNT